MDTDWFYRTMMGDKIIFRLRIRRMSGGRSEVFAKAFTYWLEDSLEIFSAVTYRKKAQEDSFSPLQISTIDSPSERWLERLARDAAGSWPTGWRLNKPIVCVRDHEDLAPSHPDALVHLARFEGMATEAVGNADRYDRISYGIVAKRLGGAVNEATNNWDQLLFQR